MAGISEAEKKERRQINASVLGTNAMEGMFPDPETQLLLRNYADGLIDGEQLSKALSAHALSLVYNVPAAQAA